MKLPINRRQALSGSLGLGGAALAAPIAKAQEPEDSLSDDEKFVMAAGMTREEAECWRLIAAAASSFFQLPVLHPTDATEVAQAVHVIQNKLLGRPTYRKYVDLAKAARGEK